MIAAKNSHLLAFDNLSGLPMAGRACRLATGGSFAVRQLPIRRRLFEADRPILMNGIEDNQRPDLADRAIFLGLPAIPEEKRRPESELWREFEIARPRILGALLDAVVQGARAGGHIQLDRLPRMADFALWATACETALWPAGTFARAYAANRTAAIDSILEADPVAAYVRALMAERTTWTGSATDLLRAGSDFINSDPLSRRSDWPEHPRALAGRLRRAQTFLRALGIEIAFSREGRAGNRIISVRTSLESTVSTVSHRSTDAPAKSLHRTGQGSQFGRTGAAGGPDS
jgi:hypothetical protein